VKTEYLLRFDDLCPTMDRAAWARFTPLLKRYQIKPILAVVPDNQDPGLQIKVEDAGFWGEMREWQRKGAAIGLHGYRHLCESRGGGLVPLHWRTEFAGASESMQRRWIEDGKQILRRHGLEPRVWVAPRHGTDAATVRALRAAGIGVISDGLWRRPVEWHGVRWIPQQIWYPPANDVMPEGVWTICLHANTATDALVKRLEGFLERNAGAFTTIDRVLAEWPARGYGVREWGRQALWLARRGIRQRLRTKPLSARA